VRLRDLLEPVGGLGIVLGGVRVVLLRESPVLLLDLVLGGRGAHTEHGVVVLALGHAMDARAGGGRCGGDRRDQY
jgi:hypothetical protein